MPRAFVWTLAGLNAALALAGAAYAARLGVPGSVAAPVVAAFLLQISFYLAPGFPEVRAWLERRLRPAQLGAMLFAAAMVPYFAYSVPTGVFRWGAALHLAAIAGVLAFLFVLCPTRKPGLAWQDVVAVGTVAAAELGDWFRAIYLSPIEGVRIHILGRFMVIGVGAMACLSLRRIEGAGYQLAATWRDWKAGVQQFLWFAPAGVLLGAGTRFATYRPPSAEWWMVPLLALGTFAGVYLAVALFEELFFRGVLQNLLSRSLGHPLAAQALASALFGLVHLSFRSFPNWRFAVMGALAGWFYGQAWRRSGSVAASSITHALVVTIWKIWFPS